MSSALHRSQVCSGLKKRREREGGRKGEEGRKGGRRGEERRGEERKEKRKRKGIMGSCAQLGVLGKQLSAILIWQ